TLLVCAFVALTRGLDFAAGLLVGLGLFKFQIVLPTALLFLFWRRWRFLTAFSICAAVLGGISVWLAGIVQTKLYIGSLISIAGLTPTTNGMARHPVLWQMMANVTGFLFGFGGNWIPKFWIEL